MIGLAIITHERPHYFNQCLESALKAMPDYLVVIISGSDQGYETKGVKTIRNTKRTWVAVNKNLGIKDLLEAGCNHLFLIEDDIIIKSKDVFNRYIEAGRLRGLQHLNFAHHGPANEGGYQYSDGVVDYYPHCVGAFSYYTREAIEMVGLMDENLVNCWEHVKHTKDLGDAGYTSPFSAFADVSGSKDLLTEIEGSIAGSSIRPTKEWKARMKKGLDYWHSIDPNCPVEME